MSANDAFESAAEIVGASGSVSGNNAADTEQVGEPAPSAAAIGKTVWYKWTPAADALVSMGLVSAIDTVIAVYVGGPALAELTELVSNDDTTDAGRSSSMVFLVGAGITYYIQVGAYGASAGGAYELQWGAASVTTATLTGLSGTTTGNTASDPSRSLWYEWTAPETDVVELNMFGTPLDVGAAMTAFTPTHIVSNSGSGLANTIINGAPPKLAFMAIGGEKYYIKVVVSNGGSGGPFTLRWAAGNTQTSDWYSAAAYWSLVEQNDFVPWSEVQLAKAPTPTARVTLRTPSNPALLKDTTPTADLMMAPGAAFLFFYPLADDPYPNLNRKLKSSIIPTALMTVNLPFRMPSYSMTPTLSAEYLSPGLFSAGGHVRPIFGVGRADQVAFECEFVAADSGGQYVGYAAPTIAALSCFAIEEWSPGSHQGAAFHGFVNKDAVYPYSPADLVFGVSTVVTDIEARTDTVYVGGVAVRTATITTEADEALSVRMTVLGADPTQVSAVSTAGYLTDRTATRQVHGVSAGLTGCKYVYQSQFTSAVDLSVQSVMSMLTQPYWLGPERPAFWTSLVDSFETIRVIE